MGEAIRHCTIFPGSHGERCHLVTLCGSSLESLRNKDGYVFPTSMLCYSPAPQASHVIWFTVAVKNTSSSLSMLLVASFSSPCASPSSLPLPPEVAALLSLLLPLEMAALQRTNSLLPLYLLPPSLCLSLPTRWRSQTYRTRLQCTGRLAAWMGRRHADLGCPSSDPLVPPWYLACWRPLVASDIEGCSMGTSYNTASPRLATHHCLSSSPLSHLFLFSTRACCYGDLCLVLLGGLHGLSLPMCVNDYIPVVMCCPLISIGVEQR